MGRPQPYLIPRWASQTGRRCLPEWPVPMTIYPSSFARHWTCPFHGPCGNVCKSETQMTCGVPQLQRPKAAREGKLFPTSSAATVPFWTLWWSQRDEVSCSLTFPHIEAGTINRELSRQRDKLIRFLKFLSKHSQQARPQTVCLSIAGPWAMADPWEPGSASWWQQGDSRFLCSTDTGCCELKAVWGQNGTLRVWVVGLLEERMEVAFAFTALRRDLITSASMFYVLSACCLLCKPSVSLQSSSLQQSMLNAGDVPSTVLDSDTQRGIRLGFCHTCLPSNWRNK